MFGEIYTLSYFSLTGAIIRAGSLNVMPQGAPYTKFEGAFYTWQMMDLPPPPNSWQPCQTLLICYDGFPQSGWGPCQTPLIFDMLWWAPLSTEWLRTMSDSHDMLWWVSPFPRVVEGLVRLPWICYNGSSLSPEWLRALSDSPDMLWWVSPLPRVVEGLIRLPWYAMMGVLKAWVAPYHHSMVTGLVCPVTMVTT